MTLNHIDSILITKNKFSNKTFHKKRNKIRKTVKFSNPLTNPGQKSKPSNKMNCNPIVDGKTVDESTCYTKDILNKIKEEYNASHPSAPIRSTDAKTIKIELQNKLSCGKEDCWLKTIKNEKKRKEFEDFLFAPKHPKEWHDNPNEWLSNIDIFDVLHQYEKKHKNFQLIGPSFIDFSSKNEHGSCVSDLLCKFSLKTHINHDKDKVAIVFNLDKHTGPGTHWVSLFIDIKDKFIFYFDSAGSKIPKEIMELVKTVQSQGSQLPKPIKFRFFQNAPFEHQQGNTECGMYSLFFIITMLTDTVEEPAEYVFKNYKDKITFFKKVRISDKYVEKLRKEYFNS